VTLLVAIAVPPAAAQTPRQGAAPATSRLVEDLRYDPDGEAELARPNAVTVSRTGDAFVTDVSSNHVVVFDGRGRRLRTFGRQGQGPGEFEGLGSLGWLGDTLSVTDQRLWRVLYFGPDGRLLRTVDDRINITPFSWVTPTAVLRGGAAYGTPPVRLGGARPDVNLDSVPVVFRAAGDTALRRIAWVSHRNIGRMVSLGSGKDMQGIAMSQPLARYPIVEPRPDGRGLVVVRMPEAKGGTTGRVHLTAFGPNGSAAWTRDWTYPAEAVTDAQFDSVASARLRQMFPPGRPTPPGFTPQLVRDAFYHPPSWAPFTRGFVGSDDRVWLEEHPRGAGQRFRLFGAGGAESGTVEAPAGVQVRYATATHAWGFIEVDDVPVLVRYRIVPEGAGR
jgi:hypothetical protein